MNQMDKQVDLKQAKIIITIKEMKLIIQTSLRQRLIDLKTKILTQIRWCNN